MRAPYIENQSIYVNQKFRFGESFFENCIVISQVFLSFYNDWSKLLYYRYVTNVMEQRYLVYTSSENVPEMWLLSIYNLG